MPLPGYTDPYADEAAEIERRRRYADMLREQSGNPIQPFSQGGVVAPISWTQGAAKLLQGYNAGAAGRDAEQRAKALRERVQGDRTSDMSALATALRGSPGGMQADAADNVTQMPGRPAGQIDPAIMGQLKSPDMQNMAMQMYMKQLQPKPNVNVAPGGVVYDPNTKKPEFTAPFKPDKPTVSWGEPYQMGGAWVQKSSDGQIRQAVAREPRTTIVNPPAPTMTEVMDPTDPTRLLRVDAKVYKGGGIGSPGVLGVSGKEPTTAKRDEKEGQGKELLKSELDNLRTYFKTLLDKGAITSDKEGGLSNAQAWVRNTGVGQLGGRILGTQEQSARNEIQSARLRLLNAIKTATGMSAQQLNSNAELKTWLDSMTNLEGSYESNMGIVDAIEKAFSSGPKRRATDAEPKPKVVDW